MKRLKTKLKMFLCILLSAAMILPSIPASATETTSVVIDATDFGVDPTGMNDSAEAVWAALEAAKEASEDGTKAVTLSFPKGEYHIYKDKAQQREWHTSNTSSVDYPIKTIGILIEGQKNLTIEGNGSLFMMHGNMMALAVAHSENITLQNFSWDYGVPSVSEMTVVGMGIENGRQYTDFYIPSCFPYEVTNSTTLKWKSEVSPYTGNLYWSKTNNHEGQYNIIRHNPKSGMTRSYGTDGSPFTGLSSITDLGDNTVRIAYNGNRNSNQELGDVFMFHSGSVRETAGAFTWESKNVTAQDINVHYMHGFGWLVQMSENVYYRRVNIMPRENSGHLTSSYADGIHASGAKGEFVIEDCNFSHMQDDPINMHGTFTRVEQRIDDNTLKLKYIHTQQGGFPQFHVGDKVQFFTRNTLESTDNETEYTVAEVVSNPGEDGNDLKTMVIKFEEELPTTLSDRISGEPKYVAENVTYAPSVTIKGCTFTNVNTRAILCTTRNKVVIEENIFDMPTLAAIFLSNDSDQWYESGPIRDMTIRNNTFYIKNIGKTGWSYAPAIFIHPVTKGGGLPDASNPIHKNITIEGNTFYMDEDTVVRAESVENLTFKNNKVLRMNPDVSIELTLANTTIAAGGTATLTATTSGNTNNLAIDNVFDFTKSKDITIENNTYDDGLKLYAVNRNSSNINLDVRDEEISVVTSDGLAAAEPVGDLVYVSSDPEVAVVDANGVITGKKAGTADVFAYYMWNDTMVRSNTVEVTVTGGSEVPGEGSETIAIAGNDNVEVEVGNTHTFAVAEEDKEVTWSVTDFATNAATDVAAISADGVLTANEPGVVWVNAVSGTAADKKAVVVSGEIIEGMNEGFSIEREDKSAYTLQSDSVEIAMQAGDLWQNSNNVKNLFLYNPTVEKDNLRTVIKVDGLPVKEDGQWDTASFILYKDDDNYVTVGKKSHFDGFATVVEKSQSADEQHGDSAHNSVTSAYLGLTKIGNTITVDYKLEGGEWTKAKEITDHSIGDDYKIGVACWHTNDRGKKVTFSDFRVGSADVAYDELPAVSFVNSSTERPSVSDVVLTTNEKTATVSYTYGETNTKAEGSSLYRFTYVKDGRTVTEITDSKVITVDEGVTGTISCQVYPVNELGNPGTPSAPATAEFAKEGLIDSADNVEVEAGNTYTFTLIDTEATATWSVTDFETNGATSVAEISADGVLTANKPGIVWVNVVVGEETDRKAVVISGVTNAGLNDGFSITREDNSAYTLQSSSVEIAMQAGDLWQNSNNVENLFLYNPTVAKDNLRTVIKVDGLPVNESGQWDTASFILYKDDSNYVTVGKKSHFNGFATVVETSGTAIETHGDAAHNDVTSAYLGFTRVGNTISVDYKLEGGEWTKVRDIEDAPIGDDYKIGFTCWHTNARQKKVTFSEFHVGAADATTYESLCAEAPITFVKQNLNRPSVSNVQLTTDGTNATVNYQFADADGDEEGRSLYRFTYVKDGVETTVVTTEKTISAVGVDEISCQVYPVDQYGNAGTPSEVKETSFTAENTTELYSITVNGQVVYTRGGSKNIDLLIPAEASKMVLSYLSVNNNIGTTTISKNGTAIEGSYGNSGEAILSVANNDTIEIARGEEVYTIKVATVESDNTDLAAITIEALDFNETALEDSYYYLNADSAKKNLTLNVTKSEACGSIEILAGDFDEKLDVEQDGQKVTANLTLRNGLNSFKVKAVAKDGITEKQYILTIVYMPSSEVTVNGITLDGAALAGFDADTYTYLYEMDLDADSLAVAVDASPAENVKLSFNGVVVEKAAETFAEFEDGENTLTVAAFAPDGIGVKRYTISVIKPYETNATVQSITLNGKEVSDELSADEPNTVYVENDEIVIDVAAQDSRATVTVKQGEETVLTGTGSVNGTITAYNNANTFTVEITAADGTTKEEYDISFQKGVYLSDLDWASATNGWGDLKKDEACEYAQIRLANEAGEPVVFQKGLGAHATSVITYNVEGKGYTALQGYVGIDYFKYNDQYGEVQFVIEIDGTQVFDSGLMQQKTPMKKFDVEIPEDAEVVTLRALQGENNWSDHADWADAKFISSFGNKPGETPDPTPVLETISVKEDPTKKAYTEGESFEPAGLVLTLTYSDGTTEEVAYDETSASDFGFAPSLSSELAVTDTVVVVTYAEKTVNIAITVEEAEAPVDKVTLMEALGTAAGYKAEDYTAESYAKLMKAMEDAGELLYNNNATAEQIEVAIAAINTAISELEPVTSCTHENKEILEAVAATCTETGLTAGERCSDCKEILVPQEETSALGHTEVIDAAVAATCTTAGKTEGKHCSVCGFVIKAQEDVAALGHDMTAWAVEKAPTYEEDGVEERHCTRGCGEKETRKIDKLVKPVDPEQPEQPEQPEEPESPVVTPEEQPTAPVTGDAAPIFTWMMVIVMAAACYTVFKKRNR